MASSLDKYSTIEGIVATRACPFASSLLAQAGGFERAARRLSEN